MIFCNFHDGLISIEPPSWSKEKELKKRDEMQPLDEDRRDNERALDLSKMYAPLEFERDPRENMWTVGSGVIWCEGLSFLVGKW